MKIKYAYLLAGAMALGFASLTHAEDKPESRPTEGRRAGGFDRDQREKYAKDLGLNPDELKNLPPEERMKKFREAMEKKHADLQKKQAAGTITEEEKKTLARMDEMKKHREERGASSEGGFRGPGEGDLKQLGLSADDLKNLSPEERRAKIKAAADKKYTELQKKKTDGTITDAEKDLLKRMEERRKMMKEHGPDANGAHRGWQPGKPTDQKK